MIISAMRINQNTEISIRITSNIAFKKILSGYFPDKHVCKVKIDKTPQGAFPFEHMPQIIRHLNAKEIRHSKERMSLWLKENYMNSDRPDVEKSYANMYVSRLLRSLEILPAE